MAAAAGSFPCSCQPCSLSCPPSILFGGSCACVNMSGNDPPLALGLLIVSVSLRWVALPLLCLPIPGGGLTPRAGPSRSALLAACPAPAGVEAEYPPTPEGRISPSLASWAAVSSSSQFQAVPLPSWVFLGQFLYFSVFHFYFL